MAGAAKARANKERESHKQGNGSSSGDTSSSGKASRSVASRSVHSDARSPADRSTSSRKAGFDGNRDPDSPRSERSERNPATSRPTVNPKNFDLGTAAWSTVHGSDVPSQLARRPPPSKIGTEGKMGLNTFNVEILPSKPIYQFDVSAM